MAENQIMEIISAFAAGCLDRENYIQFKEYYDAGGKLPLKELGELQNTIALVPIILEIEKPRPEIKAEVAKKLIALQDEIKEKIKEQKRKALEAQKMERTAVPPSPEMPEAHFDQLTPTLDTREIFEARKTEEREKRKPKTKDAPPKKKTETRPKPEAEKSEPVFHKKEESVPKQSFMKRNLGWIFAALFLIAAGLIYFLLSGKIENQTEALQLKEKQIKQLQKDLALNKKMVTDYKTLLKFLGEREISVVELQGGKDYPKSSGRLYISFRSGDAVLLLNNPPQIKEDEAYQLWLITEGKSLPVEILPKENDKEYYYIMNVPTLPKKDIQLFRITNEPKEGSVMPLGKTLLYGSFVE